MNNYLVSEKKEIECLKQVLNSASYKVEKTVFDKKIKMYLDTEQIYKQEGNFLYRDIIVNGVAVDFTLSESGKYIKIGMELLPDEDMNNISKQIAYATEDGTYMKNLISMNKALFNDDKNAISYLLLNNQDLVKDMVVLLNYEQDENMVICAINNLSAKGYPAHFYKSILFYNNGTGVRSYFLSLCSTWRVNNEKRAVRHSVSLCRS